MRSVSEKCNEKSEKFLNQAKEFKENLNFSEAILSLNKALCYATSDDQRALIYLDRGKIYYELKLYEKCLENFKLADHDLDKEMAENCKNSLKHDNDDEDISRVFSITLPTNPKIPFIANCLKLQESWKFGRGVVTDKAIKTGEVLVIEEPFFKMLNKDVRHKRCAHCLKSNRMSLIPCDRYCVSTMFCSKKCKEEAWSKFHKEECRSLEGHLEENEYDLMIRKIIFETLELFDGSVSEMKKCLGKVKNETIYNFDMTKGNEKDKAKNNLKALFALKKAVNSDEDINMTDFILENDTTLKNILKTPEEIQFMRHYVLKMMGIIDRNSYIFYGLKSLSSPTLDEEIGSGLLAYASLFNHSCSPNLTRVFVNDQQIYVAKRPIEAGQQLFVGYMKSFAFCEKEERQMTLMEDFLFKCSCEACANNYPLMKDLKKCDENFKEPPMSTDSLFKAKEIYATNCEYIENNFKTLPFPCYEMCKIMHSSFYLLQFIANKENLVN